MNRVFKFSAISLAVIILGLGAINMADAFQEEGYNKKEPSSQNREMKFKANNQNFQEMNEALENNDYNAWKELSKNKLITDKITEENFDQIIAIHELKRAGEFEEANNLATELGLPALSDQKRMRKMHKEQGQHRGLGFIDENNNGVCDNME